MHMVPRTLDREYSIHDVEYPMCSGIQTSVCLVHFSAWTHFITLDIYFMLFFWFRVLFVHLLPSISLVSLNILLCSALSRADKRRSRLTSRRKRSRNSISSSR